MSRTRLWMASTVAIVCLWQATPADAQARGDRYRVVYASLTFAAQPGRMDAGDSTELIHQITNQSVNGTLVIVPSTTVSVLGRNFEHSAFQFSLAGGFNRPVGAWILGLEGGIDMAWGSSDMTSQTFLLPATLLTPITTVTVTRQAESSTGWSVFGRAGKLLWGDFLLYGSFGVTGAGRKLIAVDTWSNVPGGPSAPGPGGATVNLGPLGPYVATAEESRHFGVLFGFGGEQPINDFWSWGVDYKYAYFPESTFTFEDVDMNVQGPVSQFLVFQNACAAAVPGETLVESSDHRIAFRLIYRLPFALPFLR